MPPQPPKPSKSDQPEDGKQNVTGERVTPEAGFDDLVAAKRKARLPCWAHLEPKLKPIDAKDESKGKKVWLECQQCNKDLAPSNVSQISVNHFDKQGNWSTWGAVYTKGRNRLSLTLGEMIVFIRGNLRGSEGQDEEVLLRELYQMEPDVDSAAGAAVAGSGAADAGVSEVIEVDD